jgi:hypothetical protein
VKRFPRARSSRGPNSKEWTGAQINFANFSSGSLLGGWVIDPPTCIDDFEAPTVIRTRCAIDGNTNGAAASQLFFGFGIYVATGDEDLTTVPAPLWDPINDPQSDWIFRFVAGFPLNNPSTIFGNGGADTAIESMAKRKIPRGAGLLAVASGSGIGGATSGTVNAIVDVRVLLISG